MIGLIFRRDGLFALREVAEERMAAICPLARRTERRIEAPAAETEERPDLWN